MEVAKVQAPERLDLRGERLRVLERGGDEVVEIDVLDVEGLAHMGAAGLQQLGDLLLVLRAVELGLDRLRRGRDLTERQRGREHLDEKRFHLASPRLSGSVSFGAINSSPL